jgi:hypothetical protein
LNHLNLSGNYISGISSSAGSASLLSLDISANSFSRFPFDSYSNFPHLKTLDLSRNYFTSIPKLFFELGILPSLSSVNVEFNRISSVSYLWSTWSNNDTGREMNLFGNPITELHWEHLENGKKQFTSFPLGFDAISENITFLNLSYQNPGAGSGVIPYDVGTMTNLKILDLSNTDVAFFPNNFCNLTQLEFLDLTRNNLGQFGGFDTSYGAIQCFSNLTLLRVLNGSYSQRSYFIDMKDVRVQDLPNLEVLNVANAQQYIDPTPWAVARFMRMKTLTVIDFSGTIWESFIDSFLLPPDWRFYCYGLDDQECYNLPTSWAESSSSLREINLSGLFYCLDPSRGCQSGYAPFTPENYSTLVGVANFAAGGFNCSTRDNYKTFRCIR